MTRLLGVVETMKAGAVSVPSCMAAGPVTAAPGRQPPRRWPRSSLQGHTLDHCARWSCLSALATLHRAVAAAAFASPPHQLPHRARNLCNLSPARLPRAPPTAAMALLRVLYDFAAEEDGELNVAAGDVVRPVGACRGDGGRRPGRTLSASERAARFRAATAGQGCSGCAVCACAAKTCIRRNQSTHCSLLSPRSLTLRTLTPPTCAEDDGASDKDGWSLVEVVAGPRAGSSGFIPSGACAALRWGPDLGSFANVERASHRATRVRASLCAHRRSPRPLLLLQSTPRRWRTAARRATRARRPRSPALTQPRRRRRRHPPQQRPPPPGRARRTRWCRRCAPLRWRRPPRAAPPAAAARRRPRRAAACPQPSAAACCPRRAATPAPRTAPPARAATACRRRRRRRCRRRRACRGLPPACCCRPRRWAASLARTRSGTAPPP